MACAAILLAGAGAAEDTVVLVVGEACPLATVSTLDLRKAYLGAVVTVDGWRLRPVLMAGDDRLEQIFYQSIVAMSKKSYERRRLSLTLKFGTPRLAEYEDAVSAAEALRGVRCALTYMWGHDAESLQGIKTIKLLWQDT